MTTTTNSENQPPPLPVKSNPPPRRRWWKGRVGFAIVVAILLACGVGLVYGLLYHTTVGRYARYTLGPRVTEFRVTHLTNHKQLLAEGRKVLTDPTPYRTHPLFPNRSDAVCHLDPSDPKLPHAIRSSGGFVVSVYKNALVIRFEIGFGRNSGLVILPEGVDDAPRFTRGAFAPWKVWKELHKGLFYYAGVVNS